MLPPKCRVRPWRGAEGLGAPLAGIKQPLSTVQGVAEEQVCAGIPSWQSESTLRAPLPLEIKVPQALPHGTNLTTEAPVSPCSPPYPWGQALHRSWPARGW